MDSAMYFPDGRFRSPTAVPGKAAIRDEHVYSAVVLAHGGSGSTKIFKNPQGQTIPSLKGSSITVAQAHQITYTEVTTNLDKAGELGSALGDAAIRAIGLTLEQVGYGLAGAVNTWGATPLEVADVASKCYFQFKNSASIQIQGPIWSFPSAGGLFGAVTSTANAVTQGILNNGAMGMSRRLKVPILVARNDSLEGVVGVAGSSSLVFSTTTGAGQASLLTCMMYVLTKSDVRG